jgi:flavin reductase (DIM6/NTAB) family NADH-FMN oxidoreductase RutF
MTKIAPELISENVFKLIGQDWMLISAGVQGHCNPMTANWGGFGILWYKPVTFTFVRPHRYTFEFMEKYGYYTLCFFAEQYRDMLNECGSKSGREMDKIKVNNLTPAYTENGSVYFTQARLVIECRKLHSQFLDEAGFHDPKIPEAVYPKKDFHRIYIGEIVQCLVM